MIRPRRQLQLAFGSFLKALARLIQRKLLPYLSVHGGIIVKIKTFLVLLIMNTELILIFINIYSNQAYMHTIQNCIKKTLLEKETKCKNNL